MTSQALAVGGEGSGNLAALLSLRCEEDGRAPFLYVDERGPWSYDDIAAAAGAVGARLAEIGIGRGDRVAIRIGNDVGFPAAAIAVWALGAAVVPVHPRVPADDFEAIHRAIDVTAVVGDRSDELADQQTVPFVVADDRSPGQAPGPGLTPVTVHDTDPALILLTSGTTGVPKGVPLTHGNAWSNLRSTVSAFSRRTGILPIADSAKPPNLIANPLSHTAGILRLLLALYVGRRAVLISKFQAELVLGLVREHGIDNLTINPAMIRMLVESDPRHRDLGAVRYVSSGTAPLPPSLREQFEARFGVPILQAYGQTEAFGGISVESVRDVLAGRRKPESVGKPLAGVEVRIAAPDGTERPAGEEGEIQARSASMAQRYSGDSSAPLTEDGWLQTGDLGRFDEDGYLYVTGRLKNLIICGGFNVYPEEVESKLAELPEVRDVIVLGLPDERLGEIPVAVVEGAGQGADADAIARTVADRLAPYKRPRKIVVVDELPRVPNGKVDRKASRRIADRMIANAGSEQIGTEQKVVQR